MNNYNSHDVPGWGWVTSRGW